MKKNSFDFKYSVSKLLLIALIGTGLYYRLFGLADNHSFWTDEGHVAIFARAILERGRSVLANGFFTPDQQGQYWLSALSAKIFGLNEFAIRFPSVIFGVLTVWAVYLLGKELFNKNVGLVSAFLTTFLKIEILWSRQARPYQALQFFYLLAAWFMFKLVKEEKCHERYFLGFLGCGILASLIHGLGLVVFPVGLMYMLLTHFPPWKRWAVFGISLGLILVYIFRKGLVSTLASGGSNNLFYYRVFLWHNYPLLVLAAGLGVGIIFLRKEKSWQIPIIFLFLQTLVVSFILPKTFLRYFYPVFPFLLLLAAKGLWEARTILGKRGRLALPFLLLVVLLGMGDKLAIRPSPIYSLNVDMQEVPEVDWKKIYGFIGKKLKENPEAILVTNWNDLPVWYLGEGRTDYWLRNFLSTQNDPLSGAKIITNLNDFHSLMVRNKKGLVILDSWDNLVPVDIKDFSQANLKKEIEVDRLYSEQPRYWSTWVYSWGLD